ncbi:MAG: hypothetical protein QG623_339 [Patescibacteria group bacterium]|nr:hypothetical protein [Patescibacteria group bacterium]
MKKLKKLTVSLLLLSTSMILQGKSFAATTEVPFDLTPLPVSTNLGQYSGAITEEPPVGDFTSTSTTSSSGPIRNGFGYRLKIPSSVALCNGGAKPYVVGNKKVLETKAANPNILNPNLVNIALYMISGTPNLANESSSFDYANTAPQGTLIGTYSMTNYYETPIPMETFNNDSNTFAGWVYHLNQEGTFTATTAPPIFSAILSCENIPVTGPQQGGRGGTDTIDDAKEKANTPATGTEEVVAFVTGAALVFVVYEGTKIIRKNKAAKKSSSK